MIQYMYYYVARLWGGRTKLRVCTMHDDNECFLSTIAIPLRD